MPIKISYILPCYNVAPYIGRCLDSIAHQNISLDEMEIICVDDCSTDNTVDLIRQYQQSMPNIVLIQHKTNKTSGGARNTGIEYARGEYIWFVDPDDEICPNVLSKLLETSNLCKPDILFFNHVETDEYGMDKSFRQFADHTDCTSGIMFVQTYCSKRGLSEITSIWRALYKRSFLNNNKIRFPEIKSSQDVVFGWHCILTAQHVGSMDIDGYHYIKRTGSVTGSGGKCNPISVLSKCLLFPYELKKMYDDVNEDAKCFDSEIIFVCTDAINRYSRVVGNMSWAEKRNFHRCLQENSIKLEYLGTLLNRKSYWILNYKLPFLLWLTILNVYTLASRTRIKK